MGGLPRGIVSHRGRRRGRGGTRRGASWRSRIYEQGTEGGEGQRLYGHPLAHAEVNALVALDYDAFDPPHALALYSTNEPCPLCLGAFYMSGLRTLRYAARDPFAGSTDVLGATPYLRRKSITVVGPESAELETIVMALHVEFERAGGRPLDNVLIETWRATLPRAVELGERLFQLGGLRLLSADGASVSTVMDTLAGLL